ncbi:hypothetical protein HMPREF1982_00451 [Clostridiales bacterium oral taxon 876 str. F0540]|nr:hypothetical protein HMPREF1982_00451 [Clostridiales bacterium oral taxon 876 str. F0540]
MKNNDFEYIKQGKIKKIVIQNTRDPGFRFIVTDQRAISELYDILSTSKQVQTKSALEPDYVFEMQESSSKVYKFNYITGLDKTDAGNLYSDDKIYIVSKRIDNDIIKSLWNIRKPKDFSKKYYSTIIDEVEKYYKENGSGKSIGINLYDDVDVAKFILSTDLENFKTDLNSRVPGAEIMSAPKSSEKAKDYDITAAVKTVGYKTFLYKIEITFWDKKSNSQKKYYVKVSDESKDGRWTTKVDTQKPRDW